MRSQPLGPQARTRRSLPNTSEGAAHAADPALVATEMLETATMALKAAGLTAREVGIAAAAVAVTTAAEAATLEGDTHEAIEKVADEAIIQSCVDMGFVSGAKCLDKVVSTYGAAEANQCETIRAAQGNASDGSNCENDLFRESCACFCSSFDYTGMYAADAALEIIAPGFNESTVLEQIKGNTHNEAPRSTRPRSRLSRPSRGGGRRRGRQRGP